MQQQLAYGLKDGARLVGLSVPTLRRYVRLGRLAHTRVGRRVLVPHAALLELLERGMRPARKSAA